jgi:hypothetical protein
MLGLTGIPFALLVGAYAWLAHDHPAPWTAAVHENGRYTLPETIGYFRHFLRELPIVAVYVAASVAAVATYGPRAMAAPSRVLRGAALAAALLLIAAAWTRTSEVWGRGVAWQELLQSYLRDDTVPAAGIHWSYHLLSTVAYVAAAIVLAAILQRLIARTFDVRRPAIRARSVGAVVAVVGALTLLCGLTIAPFSDGRFLGHQAREAATHLALTLPLSFAVLLTVGRWCSGPVAARRGNGGVPGRDVVIAAAVVALTLAYLAIGTLVTGAMHTTSPGLTLSSLLGAHCYEHSLDYALVVLLTAALAPPVAS